MSAHGRYLSKRLNAFYGILISAALSGCDSAPPPADSLAGPVLASLAVTPLALSPAFSPAIHDYSVRCAAGVNSLSMDLVAAPGSTAALLSPTADPAPGAQTVTADLSEGDAAVVQVTASDASTDQYVVRCLPHDFPGITAAARPGAAARTPGYYLLANTISSADTASYAMILDTNGTPVFYERTSGNIYNVQSLGDSTIAYFDGGQNQYLIRHLDSGATEYVHSIGITTDVHELRRLPNGHYLVLSYPQRDGIDLTGLLDFGQNSTIADCAIQEVDSDGNLYWDWRASDHFNPATDSTYPGSSVVSGVTVADVFHCNAIEPTANGDLMVSARHMDSVFLIDRQTGRIKWKLGGSQQSQDGAQILAIAGAPDTAFFRQHDARLLPNGNISLFDDHTDMPGVARGVEYALDFAAGTARMVRADAGASSVIAMGSYRQAADGSSVAGWGYSLTPPVLALTEFAPDSSPIFDIALGAGNYSYRALKEPLSTFPSSLFRQPVAQP